MASMQLVELDISYSCVDSFAPLQHMQTLQRLIADGTDITNASLECLQLLSIKTLSIENCIKLATIGHAMPPRLQHLHIMGNGFGDRLMAQIYTQNSSLSANGIHSTHKGTRFVQAVAARGTCKRLALPRSCTAFYWLDPLVLLCPTHLNLSYCRLIDSHIQCLRSITSLVHIVLSHNACISDDAMHSLPASLVCADIAFTAATVSGVRTLLANCTGLRAVYCHGCTDVAGMNKVLTKHSVKRTVHGDCVSLGTFYW